ncbi:MAG: penicillin-binding protein 1B [Candidatus Dasytiphilus stammeri]
MTKSKLKKIIKYCVILLMVSPILCGLAYGINLDMQIRKRVSKQSLDIPMTIYSRIVVLGRDNEPKIKNHIIKMLLANNYRAVTNMERDGDFIITNNTIEIRRRKFNFPQSPEKAIHAVLRFRDDILYSISNLANGQLLPSLKIDPIIIYILHSANGEQHLFLPRREFPNTLISMLLATEDNNFYHHGGIQLSAMARAMIANIHAGKIVQGGSTLTQQLVRNLFLSNKRTVIRKLKEIYMSLIMNVRYSKENILELYLNEVYLGQNNGNEIHGFPLASLYYFGRPVNELNVTQQALLIGMVKGASIYNPWHHPKLALQRRNLVLSILKKHGSINTFQYQKLIFSPLEIKLPGQIMPIVPAFIQTVTSELDKILLHLDRKNFLGIKIFTTFDPVSQQNIEETILEEIPKLRKKNNLPDLETAVVIVDRMKGEIRAIIGGSLPKFPGYNRALQSRRSIGSLVKPAIYLAALSTPEQYKLNTWLDDNPIALQLSNKKIWRPRNYDHKFVGKIMLLDALVHSINIPTLNLGLALGLDKINETLWNLGIDQQHLNMLPSSLLGSVNLTPFEVTQMYQTLGSGGIKSKLYSVQSIITPEGKIIYQKKPNLQLVIAPQAAYLTLYSMQQTVLRGTASTLGKIFLSAKIAAKTGTTNQLRDSWLAGIDSQEIVVIWVGRDNNASTQLYGSTGALKIYQHYLLQRIPTPLLVSIPEDITQVNIDHLGNFTCNADHIWRTIPIWNNTHISQWC